MAGVVPLPAAWAPALRAGGDSGARQRHERVFIHVLKMLAMALNARFHARMRDALGPHVVAGEGVMQKGRDGAWRLTPEKGVARMEGKRVSDHVTAPGCRPALNVDVLRVIGVCATPARLRAALEALGARFGGCGRVKSGYDAEDAAGRFHLRTVLACLVVDFGVPFAELAREADTAALWRAYAETSAPQGDAPRGRWRDEARAALAVLTGAELAPQPVRFICEVQLVLDAVYQVRKRMHEPYKGYRADSGQLLYEDMVGETRKVEREEQFAADGDTPLKRAARDGDAAEAARLLGDAAEAERDAAFVVACARGHGGVAALPGLAGSAGRAWARAWKRAASKEAAVEVGEAVVSALMAGAGEAGGVDPDTGEPINRPYTR